MQQMASTSIEVEAESPEDAIQKTEGLEPHLCASCSGHGNPPGIDLSYDWEPTEVADEDGEVVWSEEADSGE
ncbi:hypothetical protein [Nocardia africana]